MTHPPEPGLPPPGEQPAGTSDAAAPRSRLGVTVVAFALAAVLVVAGAAVGGWLLLRDSDRDGAAAPATAVDAFLRAVYQERDPAAASALVCGEARDEESLTMKIGNIEEYAGAYQEPQFTWTEPELVEQVENVAVIGVTVSMRTGDEKNADQRLRLDVVDKDADGWWVCDVATVGDDAPAGDEPSDAPDGQDDGGNE